MTKYYYIIHYSDGETENSFEEHGDDNFEGTFSSYEDAKDAAEYGISCFFQGGEILHLSNPGDYDAPDAQTHRGRGVFAVYRGRDRAFEIH